METLSTTFKSKNLKLTPQRIAVYQMLKGTKCHPSAEKIYNSIKDQYPTMSLATVYKTLKTLAEVGLIQEINVGEGNFRYDANALNHPHIACINCGRVDDIENEDLSYLNESIKPHTDYQIISNKVYFYGICTECRD